MIPSRTLWLILVALLVVGCSNRTKKEPPPLTDLDSGLSDIEPIGDTYGGSSPGSGYTDTDFTRDDTDRPLTRRPSAGQWVSDPNLSPVYFEYNSFTLSGSAQRALASNADFLRINSGARVLIEGHCDERGTEEYNMALGERRALAVRDYLINMGIDDSRIDVISFGEQRPAVPGFDESAYSQNRRADFKIAG